MTDKVATSEEMARIMASIKESCLEELEAYLTDWRQQIEARQREVLENCRETIAYCRKYFVNTGLSALDDCDESLAMIDAILNAGEE